MLTTLLLITAGGEIDLRYDTRHHRLRARYEHEDPGALASMRKHGFPTQQGDTGLRWIDSDGVLEHPLPPLTADEVAEYCAKANEKAIVVTCELGLALEYARLIAWKNLDKVVILTGSNVPQVIPDSDADLNVGFALAAAQLYQTPGVYIAFEGKLHIWHECKRIDHGFWSAPRLVAA